MNKLITITLLFVSTSLLSQNIQHSYSSKSGKIAYTFEMDGTTMDYRLIFDENGKKQAFETITIVDGAKEKVKTIISKESIYLINYSDEQVIKMPTNGDESMMGEENSNGIDVSQLAKDISSMSEYKKGNETLLGKSCDLYTVTANEGAKGKYWIWKGYLLKAEFINESGQHYYIEATELSLDINIAQSEFEVPTGFTITDMGAMMQQMQQMQQMYGAPEDE